MTWILETRLRSWAVLGIAFLSLAAAAGLVAGKKVLIEIFPASDQTFFAAKIELPVGTSLQETRLLVAPLKKSIDPFFAPQGENGEIWFKNVVFTVGKRSDAVTDFDDVGGLPEEHVLGLTFNLTDKEDRQTKSYTILPLIQKAVEEALPAHAELRFSEVQEGPPTGSPIEIRLAGSDMAHLEVLADEVSVYLEDQPETRNVRDSRSDRTLQVVWRFDRDMLAQFGLTPTMISESLRSAVNGITVVQLVEGDEEIDVDIRIDWEGDQVWDDPTSLDHLERIPLRTPSGAYVTLRQIATPELTSELSVLEHRDGKRVLVVRSDLEKGVPASKLTPRLKNLIKGLETHPGESIEMGGENEEGLRLMREMTASMLFALLLILVALVWQFNSFWEATVILLIIPLSLTGVILGFFLLGLPISFPTMIGIVSLAGIIVNDAIVLIDQINHNARKHGLDRIKAFIRAGKERMQPIALTSITTVVGLLPLSLSDEVWAGLGFAIIFGMMLSTVLTLLLVPCFLRIAHK